MSTVSAFTAAIKRVLPGAVEDFDEFAKDSQDKVLTGDCGEYAEDAAIHIAAGVAFTPDEMHAIVQRDVDHHWASTNGAEPLQSIADDLDVLKLLYTQYSYPGPNNFLEIIEQNAGYQPVIMETSNGQALAGDEPGLQYHFICIVGLLENGNFLCCDGDNARRADNHLLCEYTPTMIDGSRPCGLIVLKYPQKDPFGYTVQANGDVLYNDSGILLSGAVADFVKTHNVQEEVLSAEYQFNASNSVTPFTNGLVLVRDAKNIVYQNEAGEVIKALIEQIPAKTKAKIVQATPEDTPANG